MREGNGTPLQYSCLENPMDGGAWWAAVHGVTKSQTRLSDFTFTFHFHALEKEMATHSSVLAWRIPGMTEPGGLPSMESHSRTRLKRLSSSSSISLPTYSLADHGFIHSFIHPSSYHLDIHPFHCIPVSSLPHPVTRSHLIDCLCARPCSKTFPYFLSSSLHHPSML